MQEEASTHPSKKALVMQPLARPKRNSIAAPLALFGVLLSTLPGLLSPHGVIASGVLNLKGTVFSILKDEFVFQSGRELFYLKKEALTQDQRAILERANMREITLDVPMDAVTRVRSDKPDGKKPDP